MADYQRIVLQTGERLGDPGPLPHDLVGLADSDLADLGWTDPNLGYVGQGFVLMTRKVSALGFMQRLSAEKRIAIRAAAGGDAIITDFLDLLSKASIVDLDHEDTVNGLNYLVSQGLLTAEEVAAVRA
jgi:hypothetical protein